MSFFHVNQREALNQGLVEIQSQINVLFEFLPPHTSGMEQTLWKPIDHLGSLKPKSVLVAYGTNSGERNHTHSIIKGIKERTGLEATPHLICINATRDELRTIAQDYWNSGIRHIVALRGDLSSGSSKPDTYVADPVTLLKEVDNLDISAAAYPEVRPEAKSAQMDSLNLKCKVEAGANRTITQFFFDVESYPHSYDHYVSANIDMEIVPGILPVSNSRQAKKFVNMANVHIPVRISKIFGGLDNDAETRQPVGASIAMGMVKILSREGVKDFRFYTLNRAEISYATCHTLGVCPV